MTVSGMPDAPRRKPKKAAPLAVAARQGEAEDGYVALEHCGVSLRIPIKGKLPISAIDAFRDGDNYGGTKEMLGSEQWALLRDAGMTADDLDELGVKITESLGN